jgi:hypothetical protein
MKKCNKCNLEKNESEFHVAKSFKDGLYTWCKICKSNYDKVYRQSDKIQNLYHSKEYIEKKLIYRTKRLTKDRRYSMLAVIKNRAKNTNKEFNITIEDIVIPKYCPLLEIKLCTKPYGERGRGKGFAMNTPSVDRIDNSKGYIKGNVRVISMKANAMKYSATEEELIKFCTNVLKQIKKK